MIIHWADVIAEKLLEREVEHRIATGISPSGHIHLGNLREMMTADAVRRAVLDKGGIAKITYIADTFDPLRRLYPFLPKSYEKYIGMPLSEIPDPEGCHESYSEHFLTPFLESVEVLGIDMEVEKADMMYKEGRYATEIRIALDNRDKISRIMSEVTGRELEVDWYPFMPFCEKCKSINSAKVTGYDDRWIYYKCGCGNEGKASYSGGGKLSWRVDWAARWRILNITCEPFGKDHAASGGSYDTGVRLAREVFGIEPPFPIVYEWIHLKGVGAMKSSKGIVVPVKELVDTLPPEIVRFIIIRSKPERHIEFDPSTLLELIEDFEKAVEEGDRSTELSMVTDTQYSNVPFKHIIVVGQIAKWELEKVLEMLERTGYQITEVVRSDVERKMSYAKKWLRKYAPERLVFEITEDVPTLKDEEKVFLNEFSKNMSDEMGADEIHQLVYDVATNMGLKPKKAFGTIYKVILGKTYGPRIGYFLKSLGAKWVERRFKTAYEKD